MKEYEGNDNIYDLEHEELAVIEQTQEQHENCSVTLFRVDEDGDDLKEGDLFVLENYISGSNSYTVDDDERQSALDDPEAFVCNIAMEWADNGDDDTRLERLRWGFDDLEDLAVEEDFVGECAIIICKNMYSYSPVSYADETFDSCEDAQAWIDEQEEGTYYLDHNEAGRPSYTIVEAFLTITRQGVHPIP